MDFLRICDLAREGDADAVNLLIELARPSTSSHVKITDLCPSILKLSKVCADDPLCGEHVSYVRDIVAEFMCLGEKILDIDFLKYQQMEGFTKRIIIFEDENIEIRAHFFDKGIKETFIHNHGDDFITMCLEGNYVHKIFSITNSKEKTYVEFERKKGNEISPGTRKTGSLVNSLYQPFTAGQALFLSSILHHTIEGQNERTSTFLVRYKGKAKLPCIIFSQTNQIEASTEKVVDLDAFGARQLKKDFVRVLQGYKNMFLPAAPPKNGIYFSDGTELTADQIMSKFEHVNLILNDVTLTEIEDVIVLTSLAHKLTLPYTSFPFLCYSAMRGILSRITGQLSPLPDNLDTVEKITRTIQSLEIKLCVPHLGYSPKALALLIIRYARVYMPLRMMFILDECGKILDLDEGQGVFARMAEAHQYDVQRMFFQRFKRHLTRDYIIQFRREYETM